MSITEIKKLLVFRLDHIGDYVLTTPVFRAVKENNPDVKIGVVTGSWLREIIQNDPNVDEIVFFNYGAYTRPQSRTNWIGTLKTSLRLRHGRFEVAFCYRHEAIAGLLAMSAGIRERIGIPVDKNRLFINSEISLEETKGMHAIDVNLLFAEKIGCRITDRTPYVVINSMQRVDARKIVSEYGLEGKRYIVVHPVASVAEKQWGLEKFSGLCLRLRDKYDCNIVLTGVKTDYDICRKICEIVGDRCVNLAGKTGLGQLAGVIETADMFISNDTGPLHIASALNKKCAGIFTGLEFDVWKLVASNSVSIRKETDCSPCVNKDCINRTCLDTLSVDEVLSAIDGLIS